MKLTSYVQDRQLTIALTGEIDHHSALSLREELDDLILRERPARLALYLSDVEFMDSAGLGLILGRYARASVLGIPIIIRNPSVRQRKLLGMAHMQSIVKIEESEATANEKSAE